MMNLYEFVKWCEEEGIAPEDVEYEWRQYQNEAAEARAERFAELEWESLASSWQQDVIDMYRYER